MKKMVKTPLQVPVDPEESLFITPINQNNFPAKLWRLVNNPRYKSICWDSRGEGIIVDRYLFENEHLCPQKTMNKANEKFKTTNFTSFIRQLNLYGFKKVVNPSGSSHRYSRPSGDLGDERIHHFYNIFFKREHPNLLVNLKRLTSTNKARMAAGLAVNSRPPSRFQRMLSESLMEPAKHENQGPVTTEQSQHFLQRENISSYPYVSAAPHSHVVFPLNVMDHNPVPCCSWQSSFGLLSGAAQPPSSYFDKGYHFPFLQRLPTEVPYSFQPSVTSLHLQYGPSLQNYSSYAPLRTEYPHAYYPTGVLQCCSSAHMEPLIGFPSPAISSYHHSSYLQSSVLQSAPPKWPFSDFNNSKKDDVNLDTVLQIVDELQSTSRQEMVNLNLQDNQAGPSKNHNFSATASSGVEESIYNQSNQLECLKPVNTDITTYVAENQFTTYSVSQASQYIYTGMNNCQNEACHRLYCVACNMMASDMSVRINKEWNSPALELAAMQMEKGLSSNPLKVGIKTPPAICENVMPKEQLQFQSLEIASNEKLLEYEVMTCRRKIQNILEQDQSADLNLLVDVACQQKHFPKGELHKEG